jgi:hypothetical protein
MGIGAAVVQYAARLLADATSALPMAILMALLVVALALSSALLGRRSR